MYCPVQDSTELGVGFEPAIKSPDGPQLGTKKVGGRMGVGMGCCSEGADHGGADKKLIAPSLLHVVWMPGRHLHSQAG